MTDRIAELQTTSDVDCRSMLADLFELREAEQHKAAVVSLLELNRGCLLVDVALAANPPTAAAWLAVSEIPKLDKLNLSQSRMQQLEDTAVELLKSESLPLQVANVWFICRHLPKLKPRLIRSLTPLPLRTFCMLADDEDFVPLVQQLLKGDEPLPAVIGLALSPSRLIQLFSHESEAADILAARHGYTLRVPLPQARPFLASGICHVNRTMLERPVDDVRADVTDIIECVLAADLAFATGRQTASGIPPLDFRSDPYAQAVLFAAVRELDCGSLRLRCFHSAFDFSLAYDIAADAARCAHLPESLLQSTFITDAVQAAQRLQVPDDAMNTFIVDHSAFQLGSTAEERSHCMGLLEAKWNVGER